MSENPNHHSSPFFKGEEKANSLTAGCTVNPTLELLLTLPPRSYSLIRPVTLDVGKTYATAHYVFPQSQCCDLLPAPLVPLAKMPFCCAHS